MSTRNLLAITLLFLGLAVRFVNLDYPRQVVFDEVHFGKFINSYCCTRENFFDIHPPHGKLLIAAAARLGGYLGEAEFTHIGEQYPSQTAVSALRALPALAGGILPLVIFMLLLHAGVRIEFAFLGGLAVALDNALVLGSRVIALDSILLLAGFGSLLAFLKAEKAGGQRQILLLVTAGCLAGLSAGVKFTGLSALALLGVLTLWRLARSKTSAHALSWIKRGLTVLAA
ncbi:MAG: phospholipid carrier-dependent glycosyltransferase, partial [Candidatus Binatia bacterium]